MMEEHTVKNLDAENPKLKSQINQQTEERHFLERSLQDLVKATNSVLTDLKKDSSEAV